MLGHDLNYLNNVRRSDLVRLRAAVRKGAINPAKLEGILAILREVRQRPNTKPHLARSLDALFLDVAELLDVSTPSGHPATPPPAPPPAYEPLFPAHPGMPPAFDSD